MGIYRLLGNSWEVTFTIISMYMIASTTKTYDT